MVALSEFDCDKCQAISQYRRKATCITNNSMDEKDKSNIYVDQYGKRIKRKITQKQKILSETEIACVATEYQNGASTYDLACKYGCHRNTIIGHLRKNGVEITRSKSAQSKV